MMPTPDQLFVLALAASLGWGLGGIATRTVGWLWGVVILVLMGRRAEVNEDE